MLALQVAFDFRCCQCGAGMGVTLHCAGSSLKTDRKGLATVKVPCPTCHENNRLLFSPDGILYEVEPEDVSRVAAPSLN